MKKKNPPVICFACFIILYTAIIGLLSCSKKPAEVETPEPQTTFKFTVNSTIYQWNGNSATDPSYGSRINKYTYNGSTWYTLSASPPNGGLYTLLSLKMQTASLSIGTYTLTSTTTTSWNLADHYCGVNGNDIYTSSEVGDFATINISSIHSGYADGSFTARLTNINGSLARVDVTNGEFHNVKIVE